MINLKTSDLFLCFPFFLKHKHADSASDDNLFVPHGMICSSPATTFAGVLLRGSARLGVRASMGLKLLQKWKQKTELVSHHHCKIVTQHLLHHQHVCEVWTVKERAIAFAVTWQSNDKFPSSGYQPIVLMWKGNAHLHNVYPEQWVHFLEVLEHYLVTAQNCSV